MKRLPLVTGIIVFTLIVLGVWFLYKQEKATTNSEPQALNQDLLGSLPLSFQENRGQVDAVVKYFVKNQAQTIFFGQDHILYALSRVIPTKKEEIASKGPRRPTEERPETETLAIKQVFVGADKQPNVLGEEQLPGVVNYLVGDPSQWQKNVPTFAQVKYVQLYEGIDLVYSGDGGSLKYDYFVAPGADFSTIEVGFEGLEGLEIAEDGSLTLVSSFGDIGLQAPTAYQMINGGILVRKERKNVIGDIPMKQIG